MSPPLFSVDPVLSAAVGYDLGGYELTASAQLVGRNLSYGIGLSMATGARARAAEGPGAMSFGTFAEYNRYAAQRQYAYTAAALLSPDQYGTITTEIATAGVYGEYRTGTTDVRLGLGRIIDGEGWFLGAHNGHMQWRPVGNNAFHMTDPSGTHLNVAVGTDLATVGRNRIRGNVEFDYMDMDFAAVQNTGTLTSTWDTALVQTLTGAVGASYHVALAPQFEAYAGLDYMLSASRTLFSDDPADGGGRSNYTSSFDDGYRVRVGGRYDLGPVNAAFEVSGSRSAGASFAAALAWQF